MDKMELAEHEKTHTGERPFGCISCEKTHFTKSLFEKSQKTTLQKNHSFVTHVGKSFSQRSHLRAHSKVHSGEKPYKCNECCKYFTYLDSLKRH